MKTTKTFAEFFTALEDAYAMEIDETIMLPSFEEEMHAEFGDVVVIYDEWNGRITIPIADNKQIEFNKSGREYRVKGYRGGSETDEFIETFYIKLLKLA